MTIKTSPNFNTTEGHFENTDGTANEKSLTELAGLVRAYFSRPDDPNEVLALKCLIQIASQTAQDKLSGSVNTSDQC